MFEHRLTRLNRCNALVDVAKGREDNAYVKRPSGRNGGFQHHSFPSGRLLIVVFKKMTAFDVSFIGYTYISARIINGLREYVSRFGDFPAEKCAFSVRFFLFLILFREIFQYIISSRLTSTLKCS